MSDLLWQKRGIEVNERIMRFLTIALDKIGVKYNEDQRNGLIKKTQRMRRKPSKPDANPTPLAKVPVEIAAIEEEVEAIEPVADEE
jgi:hypothetical protein